MRNDVQQRVQGDAGSSGAARGANGNGPGFIPTSFKSLSNYLRIVSSGASAVASTVKSAASAASAIVERDAESNRDQVHWAGFDKLECKRDITRLVLLLGYRHGFQVWDVQESNNVHNLVSRLDGPVSFLQLLPSPLPSKLSRDKFAASRPVLIICAYGCFTGGSNSQGRLSSPCNGTIHHGHDVSQGSCVPTVVWFYSLRSQSYVHLLKFRTVVHLIRCSSRVIAVLLAAQIHCFDAATLEMDYTILTNPVVVGCGPGGIGFGPLAVGPRWMAYSGSAVKIPNSGRVNPQQFEPSTSFPGPTSNEGLVAHYAKESSKQIAAGIVTLGDMGCKKLYELLPDSHNSQAGSSQARLQGTANGQIHNPDDIGMVIVRDTVRKTPVTQFRAHKSPISSLCFDPSGTLLVTASVQGHNINVYQIIPGCSVNSSVADSGASYVHLYRLQRGFTNAVIQDISFSRDNEWVMISSSRGTSHLFSLSPLGGSVILQSADTCLSSRSSGFGTLTRNRICSPPNPGAQVVNQLNISASASPTTLSVVGRIRNGSNGWRHTVSGAAAAATGRMNPLPGAVAAVFCDFEGCDSYTNTTHLKGNSHLLVFSSPGCLIQYALQISSGLDYMTAFSGVGVRYEPVHETDAKLVVEPMRKWNISHKQNRKEREENIDIYGENGKLDCSKVFPEAMGKKKCVYSETVDTVAKDKMAFEERNHIYISEAELHMHQPEIPLWAKAEIYFQSMVTDGINLDEEGASGGEIEIERIPARMIEASSKELVPVFDYLQAPKFKQGRIPVSNRKNDGPLLHQKSGLSDDSKLANREYSVSFESVTEGGIAVPELCNGAEESGPGVLQMPMYKNMGYANNNCPKGNSQPEIVNNNESSLMDTHFNFVNNSIDGLKAENTSKDGNEFG